MAVPPIAPEIKMALPLIARGIVKASIKGWVRVLYYDPITDSTVTFAEPPSVVAVSETRTGRVTLVSIRIPAPASVKIPLKVPETSIERPAVYYKRYVDCAAAIKPICDGLNDFHKAYEDFQNTMGLVIEAVNAGFKKTNQAIEDLRSKTEEAMNKSLGDVNIRVQSAINEVLPTLYSMMGLPTDQLISVVQIRPPHTGYFEFYSLSAGMIVHYIAVGKRRIV